MRTARFIEEITVTDDDGCVVELDVFIHENGGMFAVDASYLDQNFDDEENPIIQDPLNTNGSVKLIGW